MSVSILGVLVLLSREERGESKVMVCKGLSQLCMMNGQRSGDVRLIGHRPVAASDREDSGRRKRRPLDRSLEPLKGGREREIVSAWPERRKTMKRREYLGV